MTNLKCPYCGSTDTIVRKAGELNKQLNTDHFTQHTSGVISADQVLKLIMAILTTGIALFGFLKEREKRKEEEAKNNASILLCKSCNTWEKI